MGQGKFDEAKPMYQRALAIEEKVYTPSHPKVAQSLRALADVLDAQVEWFLCVCIAGVDMWVWCRGSMMSGLVSGLAGCPGRGG